MLRDESTGSVSGRRIPAYVEVAPRSLWRVLTEPESSPAESLLSAETVASDVVAHVGLLLNARRGRCWAYPDFGMPDCTEFFAGKAGMSKLAAEIQQVIERFEPRILPPANVTATGGAVLGPDGTLRAVFSVSLRLAPPWDRQCRLRASISAGGVSQVE